jgi:PAS domain S-box-containing protein
MVSRDHIASTIEGAQWLDAVLDNALMQVAYLDGEFNFIRVNRAYAEADNREPSFFAGKNHFDLYPGEETERIFRMVVETGEPFSAQSDSSACVQNLGRGSDRRHWSLVPVKNDTNRVTALILTLADITEGRCADEALLNEKLVSENYINSLPGLFYVFDEERFVTWNSRWHRITGYSDEELASKYGTDFFEGKDRELIGERMAKVFREGAADAEAELVTKDGRRIPYYFTGRRKKLNGKDHLIGLGIDITETKRLRELESRAQRLETAGQIAGQVAHDFNNLLAPLMAYPEFIRDELADDHPALQYIADIEHAANQIADINQQLLTLGRRGHYNQEIMNLNNVVRQAVRHLETPASTLVIDSEFADDLMNIKGGRSQMFRAVTNLLVNAREAMQDIGQITIKTENFYVDNMWTDYSRVPQGEYVKLTITDTGCGIPDEIRSKIFDPFFTTKAAGKKRGSGLGISVVDAVVKDHDGYMDMSSTLGKGSSFYVYFPVTREMVDPPILDEITGGDESVLIVDDDRVQRDVSLKLLSSLGYEATAVESGEAAVEMLRQHSFGLMVLDMIMPPGIDGAETYDRALAINADQKAIIVSGFAESDRVAAALRMGAGAFVKKPLTRRRLAVAVREELDRVAKPQ